MKFNVRFFGSNGPFSDFNEVTADTAELAAEQFAGQKKDGRCKWIEVETGGLSGILSPPRIFNNPFHNTTIETAAVVGDSNKNQNPSKINKHESNSCGWSSFCAFIGWANFVLGVLGLLMLTSRSDSNQAAGFTLAVIGFAGGVSSLIAGYIIQLLFDCRQYLKEIAASQKAEKK